MYFDKELAAAVRHAVRDCSTPRQQFAEDTLRRWETECVLSRGQNPSRCAHWERKAANTRQYLEAMANVPRRK